MLDTSTSSLISPAKRSFGAAAVLGALLGLSACELKDGATAGDSTNDATTESATEPTSSTGTPPTTSMTGTTAEPDTSTGTETAGACADHGEVDDCCCFSVSDPGDMGTTPPTFAVGCGDAQLCPSFEVLCGEPDDFLSTTPCSSTSDDAALDCALAALAAGEPGSLQIELRNPMGGDFWGDTLHYYVRDDGTAFQLSRGFLDSGSWGDVAHRQLKPADFFTDCLSADSVEAKVTCLQEATSGDVLEQCIEPARHERQHAALSSADGV